VEEGVDEIGGVAIRGELRACQVADRLANSAGDNDACDKEHDVGTCGKKERQHAIPVEDVRDGNVQS